MGREELSPYPAAPGPGRKYSGAQHGERTKSAPTTAAPPTGDPVGIRLRQEHRAVRCSDRSSPQCERVHDYADTRVEHPGEQVVNGQEPALDLSDHRKSARALGKMHD